MFSVVFFYTYKITFIDGDYYYGSRASIVTPKEDSGYVGSPKTHKDKWKTHAFSKTILNVFENLKEVQEEEIRLIKPVYRTDPQCLNENCGGRINHTPEVRKKISAKVKGRTQSEETKSKRSKAQKGKPRGPMSDETKRKLREARIGQSSWNRGIAHTEETKQKMSNFHKNRIRKPHSEKTKQKMSETKRGSNNPNYGKKHKHSDETKLKISEAVKKRHATRRLTENPKA